MSELFEEFSSSHTAIYSYVNNKGNNIVESFIEGLSEQEQDKIFFYFDWFCSKGHIRNKEKFKHLEDSIYEFKYNDIRLLCFFLPKAKKKCLTLTHGFIKKSRKTPKREINKAMHIRGIIVEELRENKLKF